MASSSYSDYRTISIDFDVHKALTARLLSPSDSANGVLRRLLALAPQSEGGPVVIGEITSRFPDAGRDWVVDGAAFPHGTEFRRRYKGHMVAARVEDGALVYSGTPYDTPSAAAMAVTGNNVNGWRWWECRLPHGEGWVSMDTLRRKLD